MPPNNEHFSPCKAKRAEHARPHTENERFGRWPVWPSEAKTLGVGFQKTIRGVNGLTSNFYGSVELSVTPCMVSWFGVVLL